MNQHKIKQIIFSVRSRLPAFLLMVGIFYYSGQPAAESARLSGGISGKIVELVNQAVGEPWTQETRRIYAEKLDYPLRKAAHMTEYALLGLAFVFALAGSGKNREKGKGDNGAPVRLQTTAIVLSVLYAATDEFHQLFVTGRAGRASDVAIDALGAIAGVLILGKLLWKLIEKSRARL